MPHVHALKRIIATLLYICATAQLIASSSSEVKVRHTPDLGLYWDDWSTFVSEPPNLLRIKGIPDFHSNIIKEQEELVNKVIEIHLSTTFPDINKRFENEVMLLAAQVPGSTEGSGVVRRSRTIRTGYGYYDSSGYYRYTYHFNENVSRQTDPDLVREFTALVRNVRASELETFIERYRFRVETWTRRINQMSDSGSVGARKRANNAYVEALQGYLEEWINLKSHIEEYQETFGQIVQERDSILSSWSTFEQTRMSRLRAYMAEQARVSRDATDHNFFYLEEGKLASGDTLIAELTIGGRLLYFQVYPRVRNHPAIHLVQY